MDIQIRYGSFTKLSEEEINQIIKFSQTQGHVSIHKWNHRSGAIDLLTYFELIFGYSFVKALTKPIIEGYLKGFVGESYFKGKGETHRLFIKNEVKQLKTYLTTFYDVFVSDKTTEMESIAIVENIGDCKLYVTLNSYRISDKLVNGLADALVRTFALISLKLIDIEDTKVVQLYPNFDKQEWDYLFIPTVKAFGNYIDRYYCFSENIIYYIDSAIDFIEKFQITDLDEYKLIIYPRG
jgi:hypothetical protein